MDDYFEQHQELLNRFSAALKKGGADCWFDEDEIIQIFDYAGDIGNDYLRTEALMWGARYYPESKALLERRCIYYHDVLDENAVRSFTSDIEGKGSLITNLLKYKAEGLYGEEAKQVLNDVLQLSEPLTDEEVIQVVNFAFDTQNSDWIFDNLGELRKHTEFLPSLLYEVGALSYEGGNYERTIPVLEELVSESPYSIDYWDMLTKAYYAAGREEDASEALEMELAIDPNFLPALQIKAHTLALKGKLEEIDQIQKQYPNDQEIAEAYLNAMLFAYKDRLDEKRNEIIDYLVINAELYPQSDMFIDRLLTTAPEKAETAINNIWIGLTSYTPAEDVPMQWKDWVDSLVSENKYSGAITLLEFFFREEHVECVAVNQMRVTQALLYFATKQWEKVYNTINENPSDEMRKNYMISVAETMSLLKIHKLEEARSKALYYVQAEKDYTLGDNLDWTGVGQLSLIGLGLFMTDVISVTDQSVIDEFDADKYDPLHFWS